ncbi:MAG: manganese efflux pump MntP [Armatimonadota bacterium]
MSLLLVTAIAFGLALDAFAVAVASSVVLKKASARQTFRLSFHFGLFQSLMPIIGWSAGVTVQRWVQAWDHWVAFALLALIGVKAVHAALTDGDEVVRQDPTRGLSLVMLSVATSVDALAVGLSFAMLRVTIWYPAAVIGAVAGTMTLIGVRLGSRLGARFGKRIEVVGGLVLIAIGAKILFDHLSA